MTAMRPFEARLAALRAAKSPPCGHPGHDHSSHASAVPVAAGKPVSVPSGHKSPGAIDSRGA